VGGPDEQRGLVRQHEGSVAILKVYERKFAGGASEKKIGTLALTDRDGPSTWIMRTDPHDNAISDAGVEVKTSTWLCKTAILYYYFF